MLKSVLTILIMATIMMGAAWFAMAPVRDVLETGLGNLEKATSVLR